MINPFTTTKISTGSALTLKDFKRATKYLTSKKYMKKEAEKQEVMAKAEMFLGKALYQKIITESEYWWLFNTIMINGMLVVSPKMYKRLIKVKDTKPPLREM